MLLLSFKYKKMVFLSIKKILIIIHNNEVVQHRFLFMLFYLLVIEIEIHFDQVTKFNLWNIIDNKSEKVNVKEIYQNFSCN